MFENVYWPVTESIVISLALQLLLPPELTLYTIDPVAPSSIVLLIIAPEGKILGVLVIVGVPGFVLDKFKVRIFCLSSEVFPSAKIEFNFAVKVWLPEANEGKLDEFIAISSLSSPSAKVVTCSLLTNIVPSLNVDPFKL